MEGGREGAWGGRERGREGRAGGRGCAPVWRPAHALTPHPPPHTHTPPTRLFPQPWPPHVLWTWGLAAATFAVVFGEWCLRYYVLTPRGGAQPRRRQQHQQQGEAASAGGRGRRRRAAA